MEPTLRGHIEKVIDEGLKTETLEDVLKFFEKFEPLIKSKVDTMFGFILGTARMSVVYYTWAFYHRQPTTEEFLDLYEILQRRAQEIKSKILMVVMR